MAWIPYVPHDEAGGRLEDLYERYAAPWGGVDHIIRIHSLNPRSMENHVRLYAHLMRGPSPLSRAQREMIAVTVSARNACAYCVRHHSASLRRLDADAGLVEALATDYRAADLSPPDRAMLDYAVKLTDDPGGIEESEVAALREAGFGDRAILDICQVTAYFNFVNRMAQGLGVELEAYWDEAEADDLMGSAGEVDATEAGAHEG